MLVVNSESWCERHAGTGLRGMHLYHDNTSAHTAATTLDFLAENGVKLVSHPPYSPDLAPCDWSLFPFVKSKLHGTHFDSPEDARMECERAVLDISPESSVRSLTSGSTECTGA